MDDYQTYVQSGSDNQKTGAGCGGSGCLTTILLLLVIPVMLFICAGIMNLFK